ncbi:hypothetical protein VHEMI06212 [[Torrubiella] hemipterigena]|uniref:DNA mismatch repair protein HSM3 N-terminal domain-containing protein n=1 Tax=[Torrubiella] hemipterigena TaxID=1531966 RepID=A0A0A1T6H8_9HYPO|nr:hypothetical protein VHEMI06212 [[Torrubiella] hemipterigena]
MQQNPIVPTLMDNVPIARLEELQTHLRQLQEDDSLQIDARLLDEVELQLTEDNIPPLLPTLLGPLTAILKTTTQDPTSVLSITIKLLSPLPFTRLLTIADQESILAALSSPLPGANLLALAIIHKAAKTAADAAILSTLPEVVEELVRRWLDAKDVGVGEKAARVLGDLLETDCDIVEAQPAPTINGTTGQEVIKRRVPGHGRLWQMILSNREFLTLIVSLCSPSPEDTESPRTTNQQSLSQGRVLRLLPRLATLNLRAITQQPLPDFFTAVHADAGAGLLQWASFDMIDKEDILMRLSVVDFFETFVSIMRVTRVTTPDKDEIVKKIVKVAAESDEELKSALLALPDRTVEEEAEPLREYIAKLLN